MLNLAYPKYHFLCFVLSRTNKRFYKYRVIPLVDINVPGLILETVSSQYTYMFQKPRKSSCFPGWNIFLSWDCLRLLQLHETAPCCALLFVKSILSFDEYLKALRHFSPWNLRLVYCGVVYRRSHWMTVERVPYSHMYVFDLLFKTQLLHHTVLHQSDTYNILFTDGFEANEWNKWNIK